MKTSLFSIIICLLTFSCTVDEPTSKNTTVAPTPEDLFNLIHKDKWYIDKITKTVDSKTEDYLLAPDWDSTRENIYYQFRPRSIDSQDSSYVVYYGGGKMTLPEGYPASATYFYVNYKIDYNSDIGYGWDKGKETIVFYPTPKGTGFSFSPFGLKAYLNKNDYVTYPTMEEARNAVIPPYIKLTSTSIDANNKENVYEFTLKPMWFIKHQEGSTVFTEYIVF